MGVRPEAGASRWVVCGAGPGGRGRALDWVQGFVARYPELFRDGGRSIRFLHTAEEAGAIRATRAAALRRLDRLERALGRAVDLAPMLPAVVRVGARNVVYLPDARGRFPSFSTQRAMLQALPAPELQIVVSTARGMEKKIEKAFAEGLPPGWSAFPAHRVLPATPGALTSCDGEPLDQLGPRSVKGVNARAVFGWMRDIGAEPGDGVSIGVLDRTFPNVVRGVDPDEVSFVPPDEASSGVPAASDEDHGAMVLSVLKYETENESDPKGLANAANVKLVAYGTEDDDDSGGPDALTVAKKVQTLTGELSVGDVLLIEVQALLESGGEAPILISPAVSAAVAEAAALGLIVIVPSCNREVDVGALVTSATEAGWNAECVVVGGVKPLGLDCRARVPIPCGFGARVDCHAWGAKVKSVNASGMKTKFTGTSAASAVIAGAVALLQSWVKAEFNAYLAPEVIRALLRTPALGEPAFWKPRGSVAWTSDDTHVGRMPDLEAIGAFVSEWISGNRVDPVVPPSSSPPAPPFRRTMRRCRCPRG